MQILEHTVRASRPLRRPGARMVLTRAVSSRWKRYLRELNRSRKKCSEQSIHDLRVSLRKLIAALELSDPFTHTRQSQWLRKRLKKQFAACGPLRDIQVQMIGIGELCSSYAVLEPMLTALRKKETRCIKQVSTLIDQTRLKRFEKSTDDIQRMIRRGVDSDVSHVLMTSVANAFNKVLRYREALDRNDTTTIHTMRVAFKKFRYQAELLQPLLPLLTPDLLLSMHEFQTRMGEIQDAEILIASVNKFALKNHGESLLPVHQELQRRRNASIAIFFSQVYHLDEYWPLAHLEGKAQ